MSIRIREIDQDDIEGILDHDFYCSECANHPKLKSIVNLIKKTTEVHYAFFPRLYSVYYKEWTSYSEEIHEKY